MKRVLTVLTFAFLSAGAGHAQTEQSTSKPAPLKLQSAFQELSPLQQRPVLPDHPIPVLPGLQDGPMPCPLGVGKSCALLGGRLYFSDPVHMTEHDRTLWQAMKNPGMLVGLGFNLAADIADAEGTQACLHANTCREGNPIFGSKPSRGRVYGIGLPLVFLNYAIASELKKMGDGNRAFAILWGGTVAHVYFAAGAFSMANTKASTNTTSTTRAQMGMSIRF